MSSVYAGQIAIVGMGCRLPGGVRSLDDLAALLAEGRDAVSEIDDERFSKALYYHPDPAMPGKSYTFAAGIIEDIRDFDLGFFGLSPRQAIQTDPQQRLLLQTSWEAFDSAGLNPWALNDRNVGVYVGTAALDYGNRFHRNPAAGDGNFMLGNTLSIAANRLSFTYDFSGESFITDTACSSSMTALHKACEAIAAGRVAMALSCGVHALLIPQPFIGFSRAMMLSPDGRCKAFDASANGFVRAEGAVSLLLAPLEKAQAQGWPVLGVIRASGLNTDGHKNALWEPNPVMQESLIRDVMQAACMSGDDYAWIEAHGTGTAVGDPREAQAIGRAAAMARKIGPLPVGSVKSNIGHLEPASGAAAIAKVLASFHVKKIFPTLHVNELNPAIDFDELNINVQRELADLPAGAVGINSFGFGGTNAHVIIEPPPQSPPVCPAALSSAEPPMMVVDAALPPLILTARHKDSLKEMAGDYARMLAEGADLAALASSAVYHRPQLEHRAAIFAGSAASMAALLRDYAQGHAEIEHIIEERTVTDANKPQAQAGAVFVYSGNGAQWHGMARQLMRASSPFRRHLERVDAVMRPLLGWSVIEALGNEAQDHELAVERAEIGQPLLFAIQAAQTDLLREYGVIPRAVLGHSVGELAAAYAARKLSLEQAAAIVVVRALAQAPAYQTGGIAALGYSADEFAEHIKPLYPAIELAAVNAPNAITLSGPNEALAALAGYARTQGRFYKKLDTPYPYHSSYMDDRVRAAFIARYPDPLSPPAPDEGAPVFISTVTGEAESGPLDQSYWWANIRQTVQFDRAIRAAARLGGADSPTGLYLEIGPHAILTSYIRKIVSDAGSRGAAIALQLKNRAQDEALQSALARCYALGVTDAPRGLVPRARGRLRLPPYPWRNETIPWPAGQTGYYKQDAYPFLDARHDSEGGEIQSWTTLIDPRRFPYLDGHKLDGQPVFPAAGFIDMLFAAAKTRDEGGKKPVLSFKNAFITAPLKFAPNQSAGVTLELDRLGGVQIKSAPYAKDEPPQIHVRARIAAMDAPPYHAAHDEAAPAQTIAPDALYALTARNGLDYQGEFRSLRSVILQEDGICRAALGDIGRGDYILHPATLDTALQLMFTQIAARRGSIRTDGYYLPFGFERGWIDIRHEGVTAASLKTRSIHPLSLAADIILYDQAGAAAAVFENVRFRFMPHSNGARSEPDSFIETWLPAGRAAIPPFDGGAAAAVGASDDVPLLLNALALSVYAEVWRSIEEYGETDIADRALYHELRGTLEREGLIGGAGDSALPDTQTIYGFLQDNPETLPWTGLFAGAADKMRHALRPDLFPDRGANKDLCLAFYRRIARHGIAARNAADTVREAVRRALSLCGEQDALYIAELHDGHAAAYDWAAPLWAGRPVRYALFCPDPDQQPVRAGAECTARPLAAWRDDQAARYDLIIDSRLGADPAQAAQADIRIRAGTRPEFRLAAWLATGALPAWREDGAGKGDDWGLSVETALRDDAAASAAQKRYAVIGESALAQTLRDRIETNGDADIILYAPHITAERAESVFMEFTQLVQNSAAPVILFYPDTPYGATLNGLRRAMANEWPDKTVTAVQYADDECADRIIDWLGDRDEAEEEWRIAAQAISLLRYADLPADREATNSVTVLGQTKPGHIDTLQWRQQPAPALGPHDVAIDMQAASLNFRDVMWAMGMLEPEALLSGYAGATLGMEGAGTVRAVGSAVTRLKAGDRVMAYGGQALASRMTVSERSVCPLPDHIGFSEAATIPAAFLTAWYALDEAARLRAGERILIHGAAGGVGLAAIQIAQMKGAEIYVTAGSPEKRAYLKSLGLGHIYDSRSAAFADALLADTNGEGVDIVLNSLSGEALHRNFDVLKPFGRYLELGKRDFYADTPVGLRPFRNNISYHGIDMDQLMAERPDYGQSLFTAMMALFADGKARPLPYQTFDAAQIHQAFRALWRSHHIGKIIVDLAALHHDEPPAAPQVTPRAIRPAAPYIVTGGHGGLGLASAEWLTRRGADHIVLLSRGGRAKDGDDAIRLNALRDRGVTLDEIACDITDADALASALASYRVIGGIIHTAAVLDDKTLPQIDADSVARVYGAKLHAAMRLDEYARGADKPLFILFSSVTTMIGNIGQAGYVAANSGLEALARVRRARGDHALCLSLGPVADSGLLTRADFAGARDLIAHKFGEDGFIRTGEIFTALDDMLARDETHRILSRMDWPALAAALPLLRSSAFTRFRHLARKEAGSGGANWAARLDGLTLEEREPLFLDLVRDTMAKIMLSDAAGLPLRKPFSDMGIDSLLSIEIHMALEEETGMNIPPSYLSAAMSIADFAGLLAKLSLGDQEGVPAHDDSALITALAERHLNAPGTHAAVESLKEQLSDVTGKP